MDFGKRWCDLTVAEYVAIERGVWLLSTAVWGIGTAIVGWLFLRWRKRRALDDLPPEPPYPYPILCLLAPEGATVASRCVEVLGHKGPHIFEAYEVASQPRG